MSDMRIRMCGKGMLVYPFLPVGHPAYRCADPVFILTVIAVFNVYRKLGMLLPAFIHRCDHNEWIGEFSKPSFLYHRIKCFRLIKKHKTVIVIITEVRIKIPDRRQHIIRIDRMRQLIVGIRIIESGVGISRFFDYLCKTFLRKCPNILIWGISFYPSEIHSRVVFLASGEILHSQPVLYRDDDLSSGGQVLP